MIRVAYRLLFSAVLVSAAPAATHNDLFDDAVVHEIRLSMHPSDWQRLRNNYLDDTYYPAILEWRGMIVEDIGVRSRGNGSRSPAKPGLKVDFNRYTPGQEFLGMKSLALDNLTGSVNDEGTPLDAPVPAHGPAGAASRPCKSVCQRDLRRALHDRGAGGQGISEAQPR